MQTDVSLPANGTYKVKFAALGTKFDQVQFGWIFVIAASGEGQLTVRDRRKADGTFSENTWPIDVPGIFAAPIRSSEVPLLSEVFITAGAGGFRGQFQVLIFSAI